MILVLGATGATGRHVAEFLLERGHSVTVIVRSKSRLSRQLLDQPNLRVIDGTVLNLPDEKLEDIVKSCTGVVSCLGHRMSFKGMYGHPRRLVTESVKRVCAAIKAAHTSGPVKFVLMNTTGNHNPETDQPISRAQRMVVGLLRILIPPHVDNEQAAHFFKEQIGKEDERIKWIVVRPDGLIDEPESSAYELFPAPIRSAIFDPGKVSRINVGYFIGQLLDDDALWSTWQGQMPVIYNTESSSSG